MRAAIAIALAVSFAASPALACVPFLYVNAISHGRVRADSGEWVPVSMETDRSLVRIEYTSSKSPTGRFAIVGNIDEGWAYGFPVGSGAVQGRAPKRTTMQRLLDQARLPSWVFGQMAYSDDPLQTFRGMKCRLTDAKGDWPLRGREGGARVCMHDVQGERFEGGLPLYAETPNGVRVLEMSKVEVRPIPLARFNPPRARNKPLVVAARTLTSCSG